MSQVKNYAACQHCIEETDLTTKDDILSKKFIASMIIFLYLLIGSIFFVETNDPTWTDLDSLTGIIVLSIFAIIIFWIHAYISDKNSIFLFYDENGQMHAHTHNPINEKTTRSIWLDHGQKWSPNPQMSSSIEHISGIIIRLRWKGWLFRNNGYNKIFENRNNTNWKISNHSMTYGGPLYTIGNNMDDQKIIVTPYQLLEVANSFSNLTQWKSFHQEASDDRQLLGEAIVAVIAYIKTTKKQGASKVGTKARQLLSIGLSKTASHMDGSCLRWENRAPEILVELEKTIEDQNTEITEDHRAVGMLAGEL